MKKTRIISRWIPVALFAVLLSCSQEPSQKRTVKNVSSEKTKTGQQLPDVKADRLLVVELEGMVCKMGCGGAIRKELYTSNAVKEVSFEFDEEKTVDVARVAYDRNKITADEIVAIIAAANEGQFNVIKTRSEAYVDNTVAEETSSETRESESPKREVTIKTSTYSSTSGSIFDLFSLL